MTTGNGGAAIGLSNDNKLVAIGELVANEPDPRSGVSSYIGNDVTDTWYDTNVLSEDVGFSIPSCNSGNYLYWVWTGASPVTLGAESRVTVTAGVITADVAGDYEAFFAPGTVIPAGKYLWVESGEISPIEFNVGDPIADVSVSQDIAMTPVNIATHFLNGPPPILYSVFSGALPPGLTLAPGTGIITGTPTTIAAATPIVFRGTDARGNSANSNSTNWTVAAGYTQLILLQANTANGSVPVDASSFARVPTGSTAIVQAAALKYGAAGMEFISQNKWLYYADDGTWDLGTEEFTIRGWIRRRALTGDFQSIVARQKSGAGGTEYAYIVRLDNAGFIQLYLYVGAATVYNENVAGVVTGTYQFFSAVRDKVAGKIYVQLNGAAAAGGVMPNSESVNNFTASATSGMKIGMRGFDAGHPLDADLDDIQIIKGTCLYRGGAAYTPPLQLNPASPTNP